MSAITTRAGKGAALTNAEVDLNFTNLNTDKAEKSITISAGTGLTGGGDLSGNRTLGLATSGVSAGTFGGNNSIPTLTIDAYGRVTAVGTVTPSGTWGISISGNAATVTSITSGQVTGALGYTPYNSTNPSGYISGINSSMVTTALGYTPYNSTNPNGYITSSASITGNAATATKINSQGEYAASAVGTTRGPSGTNHFNVYSNGYPATFGNLLHLGGAGAGQLLIGWSGTDGAHAPNYIRSKRDNDSGAWSPWALLLTDVNYNSYALPLTGGTVSGLTTFNGGLSAGASGGQRIYSYISGNIRQGLGTDLNGGGYNSTWFGSAGPSNEGTLSLGFVSQANGTTFSEIARVNASGGMSVLTGPLRINQATSGFNGLLGFTDAGGRAQVILSSYYSDLVIASSQYNSNHGSTLSFVSSNPGNSADYRKFVINQGNWGGSHLLSFGWADAVYTNPHNYAGSDQASNVMMLDGVNKIVYASNGSVRSPIFYDSNDTARFIDPSNGGFNMVGGSSNRVNFYTNDSGYQVSNAEGSATTVRLGAAWGRPGVYNNTTFTVGGESSIHFWLGGGEKGYIDTGSNLFMNGSLRAPIFYDQNDSGYYCDPNGTSRFNSATFGTGAAAYVQLLDDESPNGIKYIHANSNQIGFLSGGGGWILRADNNGITRTEDMRSRIFYDEDNTGYYMNPAGFNRMNTVYVDDFYNYSDDRLKIRLGNIDGALDKVKQLNGFLFKPSAEGLRNNMKDRVKPALSAQELQEVQPESVNSDGAYLTIDYTTVVPLLVEAIKELSQQVESLRSQIQ